MLLNSLPDEGELSSAESSADNQTNGYANGHANGHASPTNGHHQQKKRADELRRSENDRTEALDEDGTLSGCREAVEVLTRNPKKGMFCGQGTSP